MHFLGSFLYHHHGGRSYGGLFRDHLDPHRCAEPHLYCLVPYPDSAPGFRRKLALTLPSTVTLYTLDVRLFPGVLVT